MNLAPQLPESIKSSRRLHFAPGLGGFGVETTSTEPGTYWRDATEQYRRWCVAQRMRVLRAANHPLAAQYASAARCLRRHRSTGDGRRSQRTAMARIERAAKKAAHKLGLRLPPAW